MPIKRHLYGSLFRGNEPNLFIMSQWKGGSGKCCGITDGGHGQFGCSNVRYCFEILKFLKFYTMGANSLVCVGDEE